MMKRYRDWKLTTKVLVPVGGVLLLIALAAATYIYHQQTAQVHDQAKKMAHALALQIAEDRSYYTENVIGKLKADGLPIVPNDSRFRHEKGGLPLPATFVKEITERINQKGYYKADLISPWPINKARGPRTPFEREALAALTKDPQKAQAIVHTDNNQVRLVYITADIAGSATCVSCHNAHPESPKKDFVLGDLMGGLIIEIPITDEIAMAQANAGIMIGSMTLLFAGILAVMATIIRKFIKRPINTITPIFHAMAQGHGDLTLRLHVRGHDEVGEMAASFNRFMDKLHDIIEQVRRATDHVAAAAQQLSIATDQLSSGTQKQTASLDETAAALEQITGTRLWPFRNRPSADQARTGRHRPEIR